jgi:hypothetical protein
VLEVDAGSAYLLAAAEGPHSVVYRGCAYAEGLGDGSLCSLDGGLGVASGGGLDEDEALVDAGDSGLFLDLAVGDGAREAVELGLPGVEGDEGEAVAAVLGDVDVSFGGVGGGGLDDLAVGRGDALGFYEDLEEGWGT